MTCTQSLKRKYSACLQDKESKVQDKDANYFDESKKQSQSNLKFNQKITAMSRSRQLLHNSVHRRGNSHNAAHNTRSSSRSAGLSESPRNRRSHSQNAGVHSRSKSRSVRQSNSPRNRRSSFREVGVHSRSSSRSVSKSNSPRNRRRHSRNAGYHSRFRSRSESVRNRRRHSRNAGDHKRTRSRLARQSDSPRNRRRHSPEMHDIGVNSMEVSDDSPRRNIRLRRRMHRLPKRLRPVIRKFSFKYIQSKSSDQFFMLRSEISNCKTECF